jgi:flagellar hook-associated protein 2
MGTTSSSLSSLSPATPTFNGSSTFAADLQQAINHAVLVASIPLNQLNDNVTSLTNQGNELATLASEFAAIQSAIQGLGTTGGSAFASSVADTTVAAVSLDSSAAVTAGTYDLKVTNAGSHTTTLSNAGLPTVADPSSTSISASGSYTLTVGGSTYTVKPTSNTLNALAQAINSSGAAVNATIVNLGPPSAPDYRLSLQSTSLGNVAVQLSDGSNLLSTLSTGTNAQYQIDGQPSTPISSDSSTVTIAPGVTVNLLKVGDTTVTVAPDSTSASNALANLVSAYNSTVSELANNHGTAGGALTGQGVVFQIEQSLRQLSSYSGGSGSVQNLSDLGLTFSSTGQLTFNQSKFESVSATDPNDVAAFLGTPSVGSTPGTGFLGSATTVLKGLNDPSTGIFEEATSSLQKQITLDNKQISETQDRITTMQNALTAQMAAADSQIALLQSQVTYYSQLFTATQNAVQSQTIG